MAERNGWTYTRYADDLTFSGDDIANIPMLMARVRHIVTEEGFAVNPRKGRVQRYSGRQTVTGVVVNEKLALPREEVRRLRAILRNGPPPRPGVAEPRPDPPLRGLAARQAGLPADGRPPPRRPDAGGAGRDRASGVAELCSAGDRQAPAPA
jgi:hypothetical protein